MADHDCDRKDISMREVTAGALSIYLMFYEKTLEDCTITYPDGTVEHPKSLVYTWDTSARRPFRIYHESGIGCYSFSAYSREEISDFIFKVPENADILNYFA